MNQMLKMEMKKVPSYLRGLVETRARADAQAKRLEKLVAELDEARTRALQERAAADHLIRAYDPNLDPATIEPIAGFRGRYGRRGALAEFIREQLRNAYPEPLTTAEIGARAAVKFELDIPTPALYAAWRKTSIRNKLQRMEKAGEVERVGFGVEDGRESAAWRASGP
jgi:hypothetical protein